MKQPLKTTYRLKKLHNKNVVNILRQYYIFKYINTLFVYSLNTSENAFEKKISVMELS